MMFPIALKPYQGEKLLAEQCGGVQERFVYLPFL